ncbi:MAG: aldehyde dehydrogenase family protein, partial [Novosphingobium sp.]|nr:aldehyde dehydrogenase family protein [Novosphingobium sp.]
QPIPLIAETGGQNAMIVDSSALAEQVVADVIASAFDSAGQRCSALRVLCLQEEIADRTLAMLRGALAELSAGPTDRLRTDVGPVITAQAASGIEDHVERMRALGKRIERLPLGPECKHGTFVAPTVIEIDDLSELEREIFGPVLHVLRYKRQDLGRLIDAINATGYGLTFGVATRLDEMVAECSARAGAGNIYVNRNIIGAVVGVQPFGGRGLSGTGPKAGGPLYLGRLVAGPNFGVAGGAPDPALETFAGWLEQRGETGSAAIARECGSRSALGANLDLPGPVGEKNLYSIHPRGTILLRAQTREGMSAQIAAALATGNRIVLDAPHLADDLSGLPQAVAERIDPAGDQGWAGALIEGDSEQALASLAELAAAPGPLVPAQAASADDCRKGCAYRLDWLVHEVSVSIDTTAAGGNASLMAIA